MRIKDMIIHPRCICLIFYQLLLTTSIVNEQGRQMRIWISTLGFSFHWGLIQTNPDIFETAFFVTNRRSFRAKSVNLLTELAYLFETVAGWYKGDVARDDSQRRFLAQHSVAMLEQCCNHSKQFRNNVSTLCYAKNRRCESFRVTLPWDPVHANKNAGKNWRVQKCPDSCVQCLNPYN